MKLFLLRVYLAINILVFLTAMLVLYVPIWLPVKLFGERGRWLSFQAFRLWGGSIFLLGTSIRIKGRAHLVKGRPTLFVANHQSLLDTIATYWTVRTPIRTLAKAELARVPVIGPLFAVGSILVKRDDKSSRSASLVAMARHFSQGGSMLLYPEGSMNKNPPALQPFAPAGIGAAMRYGLALQPIAVQNAGKLLPATGPFLIYPGTLKVEVGPALLPEDYAGLTAQEATDRLRAWMEPRVG